VGTRSFISIKYRDKYRAIYCHFNGSPSGVGSVLKNHYNDRQKILKLISLGDISFLGSKIGKKHNFDNPPKDETNVYHRDRGESWESVKPKKLDTLEELKNEAISYGAEYLYLYEKGKWKYMSFYKVRGWRDL